MAEGNKSAARVVRGPVDADCLFEAVPPIDDPFDGEEVNIHDGLGSVHHRMRCCRTFISKTLGILKI